ncbi:hypothetical protein [Nonomuraea wenchangensis]|uniref:Uncharacterized protein n=1 Tax=Nonomuraea wenchangensis TaxID=568860 RepID=A0A1I0LVV1_9ACTN|nr:hypothetical protein [Nonomuraea wenchangensis]SEU47839.1 hypothetical protein SAMN05421811_13219 [Nonomuraea wenchangensis]
MSARATPDLLTATTRDKTRRTDLHGLIFDLLVNPNLVSVQGAGGRVLLSDRYSLCDLTTLRLPADGGRISLDCLPGVPADGTYTWRRSGPPDLLYRGILADLAARWARLTQPSRTPRPDHNAGSAA